MGSKRTMVINGPNALSHGALAGPCHETTGPGDQQDDQSWDTSFDPKDWEYMESSIDPGAAPEDVPEDILGDSPGYVSEDIDGEPCDSHQVSRHIFKDPHTHIYIYIYIYTHINIHMYIHV